MLNKYFIHNSVNHPTRTIVLAILLTLFFISDSKQKLTVFLCSGQFELSLCWKKDTFLSFFPCYVWSLLQVKHYLQNKSFHINGIHFLFQKTQNTLQSNRLSRQKGLPTLSMARSTLKIHENFLFWTFWKIEYREKFCEDTKKNISVEKFLFLFGEKEWAKNIVEQKTTRIAPLLLRIHRTIQRKNTKFLKKARSF